MKYLMTLLIQMIGLGAAVSLAFSPAFALAADPVTADVNVSASASVNPGTIMKVSPGIQDRANREIDRRVSNLTGLSTAISGMKNLNDSDKTSIQATVTNQVTALGALEAKIDADADTDSAVLKADVQSVTDSYRIYMLVLPQIRIIAAADRIVTVAKEMQMFSAKLQDRITAAQSAGVDVSVSVAALADFNAKVADSEAQAQGAVTEIATLAPDNGDKTKMAANTAALKDARAKVVAGQTDLRAARKDAQTIMDALKGKPVKANVNASASTTAQ